MRSLSAFVLLVAGCGAASPSTSTTPASAAEASSATTPTESSEPARATDPPLGETSEQTSQQVPSVRTDESVGPESPPIEAARAEPISISLPSEPVRAAIVVQGRDGAPRGQSAGWDGEHQFVALGLPAMSSDGGTVVVLLGGGDGLRGTRSLLTLSTRTGGVVRRDPLYESSASEQDTEEARTEEQQARRQIARAQRYLARRELFALRPLDEALTLQRDGGAVEILDADGRSRFRRDFVAPSPSPPAGLDEDALVAWEVEHHCDDALLDASAWRIDATHVLLTVRIGSTPDECWEQDEGLIVTLSP